VSDTEVGLPFLVSPVGIMLYGNASFMGVPWETIVKRFRTREQTPSATLKQVAERFLTFLASPELFSDAHIKSWLEIHLSEVTAEVRRFVEAQLSESQGLNRQTIL